MNSKYLNHKQFIIEEYKKTGNASEVAALVGCHPKTVREILTKEGIPIKVLTTRRKKNFNENYFEKIDSEEKAYWLGFLYADGYNYEKASKVVIGLNEKDITVLEKFKKALNFTGKIFQYPQRKSIILSLSSRKFSQDLKNKGCPQNKTYLIRFPTSDIVPNELIHHFMRGYFDGDGCITKYKYFSVMSNIPFIKDFQNILITNCNLSKLPVRHRWEDNKEIGYICYGGPLVINRIHDFLYKNATIYLERKQTIFNNIIKERDKFNVFTHLIINDFKVRVDKFNKICISDLWVAAGKPPGKKPAEWLRSKKGIETKKMIKELGESCYYAHTGAGPYAGSFAIESIALAYSNFLNINLI